MAEIETEDAEEIEGPDTQDIADMQTDQIVNALADQIDADTAPQNLGEAVARFIALSDETKAAEATAKRLKARAKSMGGIVKDMLLANGLKQLKTDNPPRTVFLHQILGASVMKSATHDQVAEAFDELGYSDLIKSEIPAPTLKRVIGEILEHDAEGKPVLPERLAPLVRVFEDYDVRMRLS